MSDTKATIDTRNDRLNSWSSGDQERHVRALT